MLTSRHSRSLAAAAALALFAAACGADDSSPTEAAGDPTEAVEPIRVVATTSILGDIVAQLVGDDGEVTVLMGPGVDPHAYSPSARDAATMREADLVVANGLQLEESLIATIEATEDAGVPVFELAPLVDPIEFDGDFHDDHGDDDEGDHGHDDADADDDHGHDDADADDDHGHDDADSDDDHGHDDGDDGHEEADTDDGRHEEDDREDGHAGDDDHGHGPEDPHVWFDAERMVTGVELLAAELAQVAPQVDTAEWEARAAAYTDQLREIDEELTAAFDAVPEERRVIVTNHDALGYLAARYDLEVVGTVIPGASTQAEANPRQFAQLIDTVEGLDIRAVFADNTDSTRLAEQLATELGRADIDLEVVQVATDALGEPGSPTDSYLGLLRETGTTIATTLAGA